MNKTTNGYNAVIETADKNYYVELIKTGMKKYCFTAYTEGDATYSMNYRLDRLNKSKFTSAVCDFLNTFKIKNFSFMDY